ncbi:MAG: hypothetical protein AB1489_26810, partial [Acidobacteriota bacterium]
MKQCPTCGDEVVAAFTATLPSQAARTGAIDYAFIMRDAAPLVDPAAIPTPPPTENRLNGGNNRPVEAASANLSIKL